MMPSPEINTDELTVVGCGGYRVVYVHPHDESKCIKIMRAEIAGTAREKKHRKAERRERDYYGHLARRAVAFDHIPRYHGTTEVTHNHRTSLACVFDLIRNDDGEVSKTLDAEMGAGADTGELAGAMHEMYLYLMRYKIISDFTLSNIVVQRRRHAPTKCVLIDDICNTDFIPICNYLDAAATIKIKRRWRRFLNETLTRNPDNRVRTEISQSALQKL